MSPEAYKLARATLRKAVREYHFIRFPDRPHYVGRIGKFEGERWPIIHFYDAMMNGDGESVMQGDQVIADVFEIDATEREAFGFDPATTHVALTYSDIGFIGLNELTATDAEHILNTEEDSDGN